MLPLNDKIKLIDELIKKNPELTIRDFLIELNDIENEINGIELAIF